MFTNSPGPDQTAADMGLCCFLRHFMSVGTFIVNT